MKIINEILSSPQTVFTIQHLCLTNGDRSDTSIRKSANYFVKSGQLLNPRRGIYAKPNYDEREMACAVFHPSYISLEYVLSRCGVTFQYSDEITSVCYKNRIIEIDGKSYSFRRINPLIWTNMAGIVQRGNIAIATPERAFLDLLYLSAGNYHFDNLRPINRLQIRRLLPFYNSETLTKRATEILRR